jgi:RNA polymerase sigma-70 factor, ECF subfamily
VGGADTSADVTNLLLRWSEGDRDALDRLIPLVYGELHRIAGRHLRAERQEHTLAPTALVNEVYLRLVIQRQVSWQNRTQFFGVAAQLMRRILVDHARRRQAQKRGASVAIVSLEAAGEVPATDGAADVLAIDGALERLAVHDPDHARIVELRFFAGLTVEEVAHLLDRSPRTIKREWRLARAWLYRELHRT